MGKGKTQYPQGRMLVIRDCMKAICMHNSAATRLLCALMYWYDYSDYEAVDGVFVVKRTQSELIQDMCDETNVTTLHSVAIPFLQLLGYLDIEGKDGTLRYLVSVDTVHAALDAFSKKELPTFLHGSIKPQLQKFGISLTDDELQNLGINSKYLEKQLQKIVIANKENCNCRRGRKHKPHETLEAISEDTENLRDKRDVQRESSSVANASATSPSSVLPELDEGRIDLSLMPEGDSLIYERQGDFGRIRRASGLPIGELIPITEYDPEGGVVESTGEQEGNATIAPSLSFSAALSSRSNDTHSQQGETPDAALPHPGRSNRADTPPAPAVGDSLPPRQDLQPLPSTPGPILQAETAPEIDEEWCNAETEHRLPAIPKPAPPGPASHEQNRDAFPPGNVAVEVDSGCTTPAPAPQVPPGVTPPKTIRATVVSPPPQVLVVSQQWTSVEDWKQAQEAFVEQLRGIWKTTTPDFKRQVGNWNGYRKQYLDRWLKANPDPTNVQFTDDGKTLFDEWCSLFKVGVDAGKANIEAANWLSERLTPWVEVLNLERPEVLRDFKGWCYTNDKKGYYTRGVKLFDLRREFEGWQSYQQSLLDKAEREKSRPQNKYGTVSGLPRLEIDPEWLKAMGER